MGRLSGHFPTAGTAYPVEGTGAASPSVPPASFHRVDGYEQVAGSAATPFPHCAALIVPRLAGLDGPMGLLRMNRAPMSESRQGFGR